MTRKTIAAVLAAAAVTAAMTVTATAAPLAGGWSATTEEAVTEEAGQAFEKAMDG